MDKSNKSAQVESFLESVGIKKYEYIESIKISEIDLAFSVSQQGRHDVKYNDDQVSIYREGLKAGDIFPPIIIIKIKNGKYRILDGIHRINAAIQANMNEWPFGAYLAEANDTQVKAIIYTVNNKHGLPSSVEERIDHCMTMIEKYGMSTNEASLRFGVGKNVIASRMLANNTRARAGAMGVRIPNNTTITVLEKLNSIKDDDVLKAAIPLCAHLGHSEIMDTVVTMNKKATSREKIEFINSIMERITKEKEKTAGFDSWIKPVRVNISSAKSAVIRAMSAIPESIPYEIKADIRARVSELIVTIRDMEERL